MELKDILLKKEELPILPGGYGCDFLVPIHPKLLERNSRFYDSEIRHKIFPKVAQEWYGEMKETAKTTKDKNDKAVLEHMLKTELSVKKLYDTWSVQPGGWTNVSNRIESNGFVGSFCLDATFGGSLILDFMGADYETHMLMPHKVKFSGAKFREYAWSQKGVKDRSDAELARYGTIGYAYMPHNTGGIAGASLLRRWAVEYLNEAAKTVFR